MHLILIQTEVFSHAQPQFVQKIYELNKVLIFEEIHPDSSIPVCPLELFLHPSIFLTLILFDVPENINERLIRVQEKMFNFRYFTDD